MVHLLQVPPVRRSFVSRRLRRTVAGWVETVSGLSADALPGEIPQIIWAEQNSPRPELPYISLRGFASNSDYGTSVTRTGITTTARVTVLTDTPGTAARISLNYGAPGYVVQGGNDLEAVRDGLIAEIESRPDPVSITPVGADAFDITGLGPALAYPIGVVEGVQVDPVVVETVEFQEMSRTSRVRVQIFGADLPDERASDYADAMIAAIGDAETVQFMSERGAAFTGARPSPQDISAASGAERESRSFFDLLVSQWTRHTQVTDLTVEEIADPLVEF